MRKWPLSVLRAPKCRQGDAVPEAKGCDTWAAGEQGDGGRFQRKLGCLFFSSQLSFFLFLGVFFRFYLFIYLFIGCFESSVAVRGLSLVAEGCSLRWLLLLRSTGSRHTGFSSCGMRPQ